MDRLTKHDIVVDKYDHERDQQFIEDVFELAFGDDAINRDYDDVLARLREFSDKAIEYEIMTDND